MSTENIPGQMSMTAGEIRSALDRIEAGYPEERKWRRPVRSLQDAQLVRDLSDRLIGEQVESARSVEDETQRVRLVKEANSDQAEEMLTYVSHGRARDKRVYGWDVIGWVLRISGEAARQRYGR